MEKLFAYLKVASYIDITIKKVTRHVCINVRANVFWLRSVRDARLAKRIVSNFKSRNRSMRQVATFDHDPTDVFGGSDSCSDDHHLDLCRRVSRLTGNQCLVG